MRSERKKGYKGQMLDGKKLADICNQIYKLQYTSSDTCTVDDFLFIELEEKDVWGNNKNAVICTEGVGWERNEYGCIDIPTNVGQFGNYNGEMRLSMEVIKSCLTDRNIDISDYIRTFGSRLDDNCWLWQSKMSVPADILPV